MIVHDFSEHFSSVAFKIIRFLNFFLKQQPLVTEPPKEKRPVGICSRPRKNPPLVNSTSATDSQNNETETEEEQIIPPVTTTNPDSVNSENEIEKTDYTKEEETYEITLPSAYQMLILKNVIRIAIFNLTNNC